MRGIKIRIMQNDDLKRVTEIEQSIFSLPWSLKSFQDSICQKNTIFLVAESEESGIIGYCGMYFLFEEGEIVNVAVDEKHRRKGAGEQMLLELFQAGHEKSVERFLLEVRKSNEPAIRFYKKLGFQESGIRKNFYEKPSEDAVIMWKR